MHRVVRCNTFKLDAIYCSRCRLYFGFKEVSTSWRCVACSNDLWLKITLKDGLYWCSFFIHPLLLNVGDIVTLDGAYSYKIIHKQFVEDHCQIDLKNYGMVKLNQNDLVAVINGLWYTTYLGYYPIVVA